MKRTKVEFLLCCKRVRKYLLDNPGRTRFQIEAALPDCKGCLAQMQRMGIICFSFAPKGYAYWARPMTPPVNAKTMFRYPKTDLEKEWQGELAASSKTPVLCGHSLKGKR